MKLQERQRPTKFKTNKALDQFYIRRYVHHPNSKYQSTQQPATSISQISISTPTLLPSHTIFHHKINFNTFNMHFTTSTIAAVATIFGFSQGALAVPVVERTSCSIQLPVAGPFKLELIPSDNPNAADPVGLTRVGPNLQKLSILPTTNQLFNYNSKDHRLYSFSDKPGLGNAVPDSDKFLTFSRDSKVDGQLTQVFGEDCEIFLVRTTASDRDIWYVDEDEGIRYAPKGNPKRTSALRIDPVSLPGN